VANEVARDHDLEAGVWPTYRGLTGLSPWQWTSTLTPDGVASTLDAPPRPGNHQNESNENFTRIAAELPSWGSYMSRHILRRNDAGGANWHYAVTPSTVNDITWNQTYWFTMAMKFDPAGDINGSRIWEIHDPYTPPRTDDARIARDVAPHAIDINESTFITDADWNASPYVIAAGLVGQRPTARGNFFWTYTLCYGNGTPNGANPGTPQCSYNIKVFVLAPFTRGTWGKFKVGIAFKQDEGGGFLKIYHDITSGLGAPNFPASPQVDYSGPTMKWITGSADGSIPQAQQAQILMYLLFGQYRGQSVNAPPGSTQIWFHTGTYRALSSAAADARWTGNSIVAPVNTVAPTISGTTTSGQTLTASQGTWTGSPSSYAYQWFRRDAAGGSPNAILGATASTYALADADVGSTISVAVTATNAAGGTPASSVATAIIAASGVTNPPIYTAAGSTFAASTTGQSLTLSVGGSDRIVLVTIADAYSLDVKADAGGDRVFCGGQRMTRYVAPFSATNVAGQAVYYLVNPPTGNQTITTEYNTQRACRLAAIAIAQIDPNNPLRAAVTASGLGASPSLSPASSTTDLVVAFLNTRHPATIADTPGSGLTDRTSQVSVVGSPGYLLTAIATKLGAGATTSVAHTLSPSTSYGYTYVAIGLRASPTPAAPVLQVAPTISGTTTSGQTLTAGNGTWQNSPTSYTYQWLRCDAVGANPVAIGGATGSTYVLQDIDVGYTIAVVVTAVNGAGSAPASSGAVGPIAGSAPSVSTPTNTAVPVISGTPTKGQTLATTNGTWNGSPDTFAYQWKRGGVAITGETGSTYVLAQADVASTITVTVTASNSAGSASSTSSATAAVAGLAPTSIGTPTISGPPVVTQTLTADPGSWDNVPTSYTYQWLRDVAQDGNFSNVAGATAATYQQGVADVGCNLKVTVTAINAAGSTAATSSAFGPIAAVPGARAAGTRMVGGGGRIVGAGRITGVGGGGG
jgi:hypothetical protein